MRELRSASAQGRRSGGATESRSAGAKQGAADRNRGRLRPIRCNEGRSCFDLYIVVIIKFTDNKIRKENYLFKPGACTIKLFTAVIYGFS